MPRTSSERTTYYDRIRSFLSGRPDAPATAGEIAAGTGIPSASVRAVLFRTHPSAFEASAERVSTRGRRWRLRPVP